MAAFTTIAAATIAIGGSVAKGALAGDGAKTASREAGRLRLEQQELEKQSVAVLEQNFYDAIRATTDVYDKQLERGNVMGAQILEAVQEGDQRGVAAASGKVKQIQDATLGKTADKFAEQKLKIDTDRANAAELSASEIAALQDDRAAAAGLKSDALTAQADQLNSQATGAFIDAGVSALQAGVSIAGKAKGKANDKAAENLAAALNISIDEAKSQVSLFTAKERRAFNNGGEIPDVSGRTNVPGGQTNVTSDKTNVTSDKTDQSIGSQITDIPGSPGLTMSQLDAMSLKERDDYVSALTGTDITQPQLAAISKILNPEKENKLSLFSFDEILKNFRSGNYLSGITDNIFSNGE